ncbi:hypothetical protein ILUMI_09860 [Ignelater luminosus]|uniref:Reverse transcriptase domain-containing protein n=1 Tax=Ignelater luminosus TaxID=2038154 RepID=A0A8K0CYZ3_IGNLU|nr:hypothetical protein ILUMI_09860 [Ignelater luminosus]
MDVRSYRGAASESDHYLTKLRQRISEINKKSENRAKRYRMIDLKNDDKNEPGNGKDGGGPIDECYDEECRSAVTKRNEARMKLMQRRTRARREEYEDLKRAAKNTCKKKKRQQLENQIGKIRELHYARETKTFYKGIKQLKGYQPREAMVKNPKGKILVNRENDFEVEQGLRQEDGLASLRFNIALDKVVRATHVDANGTILNKERQIVEYADDLDLIARSKRALREGYEVVKQKSTKSGLEINLNKTKAMEIQTGARLGLIVTYGCETCILTWKTEEMLARVLGKIYETVRENDGLRIRYNYELRQICKDLDTVALVKIQRLRCAGHVERMPEGRIPRRIMRGNIIGYRTRGRPRTR